jgi:hypothetical protein
VYEVITDLVDELVADLPVDAREQFAPDDVIWLS